MAAVDIIQSLQSAFTTVNSVTSNHNYIVIPMTIKLYYIVIKMVTNMEVCETNGGQREEVVDKASDLSMVAWLWAIF